MKFLIKTFSLLCLLTQASCGGNSSSSSHKSNEINEEPRLQEEMQITEGTYKAILRPYNFTVAGWIPNGMVDIKIVGDQIEINSWLDDSSNVVHMQNIHVGNQCPTSAQDANQDGFVDFNESMSVAKRILVPLDTDLNSQTDGGNVYPTGNFTYSQKASLANMLNDLKQQDLVDNDHIVKLLPSQNLNLEGRVIIVTGAAINRALPTTVSTVNGQTSQLSMPIACGVIVRMPEVAGN